MASEPFIAPRRLEADTGGFERTAGENCVTWSGSSEGEGAKRDSARDAAVDGLGGALDAGGLLGLATPVASAGLGASRKKESLMGSCREERNFGEMGLLRLDFAEPKVLRGTKKLDGLDVLGGGELNFTERPGLRGTNEGGLRGGLRGDAGEAGDCELFEVLAAKGWR